MEDIFDEFGHVPVKPVPKPENKAEKPKTSSAVVSSAAKPKKEEVHPSRKVPYRLEKTQFSGSAEGIATEGCPEHNNERAVAIKTETFGEESSFLDEMLKGDLEKYIIMSEILKPKF
jgi:hypothetical protein